MEIPKERLKNHFFIALTVIFILVIAMFKDVLFTSRDIVLSHPNTDIFSQFIHWRAYGFNELKRGNLALWNPYVFSGTPYLGEFQSALLYPLNLLYLFLPVQKAINVSIALHVFLGGVFMYLWVSYRKIHPLACFLSSVLFMFCGAHFLHIFAGHLSNLCSLVWAPLIFLAVDGIFKQRSFNWCLLGMFSVAMQILAGHPQYVFYTAVAVAIYSGFCLVKATRRIKIIGGIFAMYCGALALTAVQVLTGIQAAAESVRAGGLPFRFASAFSFPPENFITFFTPGFFGDNIFLKYWGRCYLWEMSVFLSITGLFLAVYACVSADKALRRFSVWITAILLLFALGEHTPFFRFFYTCVPGFNLFRGSSKFILLASMFIILLAGIGLDKIIRSQRIPRRMGVIALLTGVSFIFIYFYFQNSTATGLFAAKSMLIAGATCLLVGLLFILRGSFRTVPYLLVLLAVSEVFVFARHSLVYFDFSLTQPAVLKKFSAGHPGDYRILWQDKPNSAMSLNMYNIWGNDPCVSQRYAEFMSFTQGQDPDYAGQYLKFSRFLPLYKMLRCRYAFNQRDDAVDIIDSGVAAPHLLLIGDWRLITKRDTIFAAMQEPDFNPDKTVILETQPNPLPVKSANYGQAKIAKASTDYLLIEADLAGPAILLITDAYRKGWRAKALPGSMQKKYAVLPANYILNAVALSGGHHYFRLEYMPSGFIIGKWISLVSLVIYVLLLVGYGKKIQPE